MVQEFRTAPAVHGSGRSHPQDRLNEQFAKDFGLTDIRTSEDGKSVMQNVRERGQKADFAPTWGDNVPHAQPGWSERNEKAPTFSPGSIGVQGASVVQQVKPILSPPRPKYVNPPQPNNTLPTT